MSAIPEIEIVAAPATPSVRLSRMHYVTMATVVAVLGVSMITPSAVDLWTMWHTDALKSAGMIVPLVSLVLILRVWRQIGWQSQGTWWGLPLLLTASVGAWVEGHANLILVLAPGSSRIFPPPSLVCLAYGIGVVLLLGGVRLLRAALFPVLLLFLVNPIPHAFTLWVDLPLQRVSAEVARALAIHLGYPLTPDRLRLMFTPEFGMFIAPGCDGLRGAMTMGLIALVTGYVYRFRWIATGLVTLGAVLLGYGFNLLRLCLLVLYYMVAMHFPSLQNKAEQADYVIGAGLFLVAAILLFSVIQWLRDRTAVQRTTAIAHPADEEEVPREQWGRLLALGLMAAIGCFWIPQAIAAGRARPVPQGFQPFPERINGFTRERIWNETGGEDQSVVYMWAQYASTGGETSVAIGISPVADWHNPLICHAYRGEAPRWEGEMNADTAQVPVEFSSALYNDGVTEMLEASTLCGSGNCGEFVAEHRHLGFVYNWPRFRPATVRPARSTRVLLKVESTNPNEPADEARRELEEQMKLFLAGVDLNAMTVPDDR